MDDKRHLSECRRQSLAEQYPNEKRPPDLTDTAWTEVKFALCAPGCPYLQDRIDRGVALAATYGW